MNKQLRLSGAKCGKSEQAAHLWFYLLISLRTPAFTLFFFFFFSKGERTQAEDPGVREV